MEKRLEKLSDDKKNDIAILQEIENETDEVVKAYEEEIKQLELKYDAKIQELLKKKQETITSKSNTFNEYWLRALTNNKMLKEFINEEDKAVLKHLTNVGYSKLDGHVLIS